jgi:hypothetical protein
MVAVPLAELRTLIRPSKVALSVDIRLAAVVVILQATAMVGIKVEIRAGLVV